MKSDYDIQEWRLVPLGHWNRKWNAARSHYHTYEHELLAGVLVLASQHRILGTNPITWLCDQDSVKYFMERPPPDGKRLRFFLRHRGPPPKALHQSGLTMGKMSVHGEPKFSEGQPRVFTNLVRVKTLH